MGHNVCGSPAAAARRRIELFQVPVSRRRVQPPGRARILIGLGLILRFDN